MSCAKPAPHATRAAAERERNRRIERALPLLHVVVRRLHLSACAWMDYDELTSIGRLALVELLAGDAARPKVPLSQYLRSRLRWAILDRVRRQTHGRAQALRRPISLHDPKANAALAPLFEGRRRSGTVSCPERGPSRATGIVQPRGEPLDLVDPDGTPEDALAARRRRARLAKVLASLPPRQRRVIEEHYGEGAQLDAIGERLGISPSWTSRLHTRALTSLRIRLRDLERRPGPGLAWVRRRRGTGAEGAPRCGPDHRYQSVV